MNRKGFAPIIILLAVGICVALGIWYYQAKRTSPSQLENDTSNGSIATATVSVLPDSADFFPDTVSTSGWKIYKNPQYGFSFSYPSSWPLVAHSSSPNRINFETNDTALNIITWYQKSLNQSLLDWYREHIQEYGTVVTSTPLIINGYDALDVSFVDLPGTISEGGGGNDLLLTKDNKLIIDFYLSPIYLFAVGEPTPRTVLNTFLFQ